MIEVFEVDPDANRPSAIALNSNPFIAEAEAEAEVDPNFDYRRSGRSYASMRREALAPAGANGHLN